LVTFVPEIAEGLLRDISVLGEDFGEIPARFGVFRRSFLNLLHTLVDEGTRVLRKHQFFVRACGSVPQG
jgi:hypothetical protein